jgi:hypothetical protein
MEEDEWLVEAKILASLNHPNIMKFFYCNKYETTHSWRHFNGNQPWFFLR